MTLRGVRTPPDMLFRPGGSGVKWSSARSLPLHGRRNPPENTTVALVKIVRIMVSGAGLVVLLGVAVVASLYITTLIASRRRVTAGAS